MPLRSSVVTTISLACVLSALNVQAEDKTAPSVLRLPPCAKAPVIDGTISPGEWDGAFQGSGVMTYQGPALGKLELRKIRYWFTYDAQRIYIAVQSELPPWGKLEGKRRRVPFDAANDDEIELHVDPARPGKAQYERTYYDFLGNFAGTMCPFAYNAATPGAMPFTGKVEFQNSCKDGWWTAEFSAAASELEGASIGDGLVWGLNFCRMWLSPFVYSSWPSRNYLERDKYLMVTMDRGAPVVQLLGYGDPHRGRPGFEFSIYNPTAKTLEISVAMRVQDRSEEGKMVETTKLATLPPGSRERVAWQTDWTVSTKDNLLSADVRSADGKTLYFNPRMEFDKDNGRATAWVAPAKKEKKPVTLTACFYPGFSRVRALVNFSPLEKAAQVDRAVVSVKNAAGKELGSAEIKTFKEGERETSVQLPRDLAEGTYTVTVALQAGGKAIGPTDSKTFEKKKFPFENNTIGITDKVLTPWTPMKTQASGSTPQVEVWNRVFTLGEDGFFQQVKSGKWELLSRPIRLETKSGGNELKWKGTGVKFGMTAGHEVDFTAASECDKVRAEVCCHSEYDGMFKYTLTLAPSGDGQVDSVDLVVPLKEEYAWLLHACSDGCRTNASLFTPRGEGRVWDSTRVQQGRLTGTFIPYLWLGDDRVGLCWWADSEKGWVRPADKKEPAIEVRREKGEIQMVFHLIGKPFRLKQPRTMVFAFNASPMRPRASWARGWTTRTSAKEKYLKFPIAVDGSCAWVSFGKDTLPDRPYTYASLRPISDQADQWLKVYAAKFHADGRKLVVYTDIMSRAVDRGEEVKSYASEWDRYGIPHPQEETRGWPSNGQILVNMTKSRIDYDVWCMKRDAELGVDGFYFDEIQATGQTNATASLGFQDDEGNWEGECSLFAFRDYLKRLHAMLQEMGQAEPLIMPHDSSTMYAGPMAFASIPMDLEMASPDPDPQRGKVFGIGEGYALCNVMGFQHGFAGSALGGGMATPTGDCRDARTYIGSLLLFDCGNIFGSSTFLERQADYALGQFGYDQPGVQYVPYWRAGNLQQVEPGCVRTSLFRNGNRALLVMYNDGPNAVTATWLPSADFKQPANTSTMAMPGLFGDKEDTFYLYTRDKRGAWPVFIPPYDYRLVITGTEGTWGPKETWGPVDPKLFERNLKK